MLKMAKRRVSKILLLTMEISTKPMFLLLWLQRQAHVHFDPGLVTFEALFKLCQSPIQRLKKTWQTLQITGRNAHVLAAAATATKL